MFDCSVPTSPPGIEVSPPARRTQQNVYVPMGLQERLKTTLAEGMGAVQDLRVLEEAQADRTLQVIMGSLRR